MKTSVVILNWNGKKLLEQFLPSVLQHSSNEECDVVVADNNSSDDSLEFLRTHYPGLPVIVLDKNYGFAEGYNKALQQLNTEYIVLLNSDVETTPDWVKPLVSYMDMHPEVAAVQPKIRAYKQKDRFEYAGASGGFIDRYGYPFCRGRILEVVEEDRGQYDTEIPVFWATGACLCIRKKEYAEAGGLDGRFFAHMEEIDLCWRLNARGRKIMCIPSSIVYHVGGASLNQDNPKKMYLNFRNNLLMIYKNIPRRIFYSTFTIRLFFDILACLRLLLKGNFHSARAVIDAYRDFLKMGPSYKPVRQENLRKTSCEIIPVQYRKSILIDFYFRGKKTYAAVMRN
ncbi:MAG: glycosyltransferase family 2 protein [Proteiniphilum sp.]|uniref:glycosyltransferase family 2 protein n=1 Tax=Proteiniphilum sp. TaxID=1926877 RepID=UPI00092BB746|nr:glycosyltransferase family 2 protein [Proteiniphilum sp.]MEA5127165.1 glycosyltransferase family 2 protein [Proteiniphilum sp.]OJV75890.1 MAG: glycosyl transferase family 2 [Bacteroidia bacterium 44-10]